jgi:hypothetical protein
LAVVSALAVLLHPQQQQRFQASWLFSLWICSGIGAAVLLRHLGGRLSTRWRVVAAACPIALVAMVQAILPTPPAAYAAAIRSSNGRSDLDLAAAYLPVVGTGESVAFLGSLAHSPFFLWTVEEQCRCRARPEQPWIYVAASRDEARRMTAEWLATTEARRLVLIHTLDPGPDIASDRMAGILDALKSQTRFIEGPPIAVPSFPAVVSLWKLAAAATTP